MTLPTVPVTTIRLGTGAGFGDPLILGDALDGILGTNVLATSDDRSGGHFKHRATHLNSSRP
jgi:hypothetical protein